MATYSTNLALTLMATGEQSNTWGDTTNTNLGTLLEQAISGYVTQAITDGSSANTTITIPDGATGVARNMFIEMTGALTFSTTSLIVPANKKMYFVFNNTTGGYAVTVKVTGQTGILVPNGKKVILTCNGTDIVEAHTAIVGNATMGGTLGVTGASTIAALSATTGTFSSTLGVTGVATLGNGAILGTPASGTVTNLTGTASININGTVGATTPATVAGTTISATGNVTLSAASAVVLAGTTTTAGYFANSTSVAYFGTFGATHATKPSYLELAGDNTLIKTVGGTSIAQFVSGATTLTGTLGVSGVTTLTGQLGVGTTPDASAKVHIAGAFAERRGLLMGVALAPPVGATINGAYFANSVTTAASGTHSVCNGVRMDPLVETAGGASVTLANTLYIGGAPTIGTANYALNVASGATSLGGTLGVTGKTTLSTADFQVGSGNGTSTPGLYCTSSVLWNFARDSNPAIEITRITNDGALVNFYNSAQILRGSISISGANTAYNTTSDGTLKNKVGTAPVAVSKKLIMDSPISEFTWKDDPENKLHIGPIAQELYESGFHGAVNVGGMRTDEKGNEKYEPWAVDKTAFQYHLVVLAQDHEARIAELVAKVAALEAR